MTDTTPPAQRSNIPVVLRIVLALFCLLPAAIGICVLGAIAFAFVYEGFRFLPSDEVWMQLFVGGAAVFILVPAIAIGVILRFARWRAAPTASLVLAVIVAVSGLIATGMLETTVIDGDTEAYILLMAFAVAGIAIGALPPLLHWWNARHPS
jgi:hypothetical protein